MSLEVRQDDERRAIPSVRMHRAPFAGERPPENYITDSLDKAIQHGYIRPYFQPVVRTLTEKLCGFEALARWDDPLFGLLSPADFIPVLEKAELIHKLDCAIIEQICRVYAEAVARGEQTVPVSFNLSRLDFDLCDMFGVIEKMALQYKVPRHMLNIEITESVLGNDPSFMTGIVRHFHNAGYQVWMDDFGSGYSSLNTLKDFDFDEIKIDMEFLNRFGDKSKIILASVVDMAKKLGVQTLAEGVETEEHRTYLRRIGCEKMQGFLYGRPQPYDAEFFAKIKKTMGVETADEQLYQNEVGSVNTLSISERDLTAGAPTRTYATSMPLATVEYDDNGLRIIDSNSAFRESLTSFGVPSIEILETVINDETRPFARQLHRIASNIADDKFARVDYLHNGMNIVIRAKHITTHRGKTAMLCSVDNVIAQSERKRHERMSDALSVLYSIYEHVALVSVDEMLVDPIFDNAGFAPHLEGETPGMALESFLQTQVFFPDRARFREFMDPATMIQRVNDSGERFLIDFFRVRQRGGDFSWMLFALIPIVDGGRNQVMVCARHTHWTHDGLLQKAYDRHNDEMPASESLNADMAMTDGALWRAISRDSEMGVFWKDRNRRFIGANRKFLDYYNFSSVDEIIGKTDEDMGWHIDPAPFQNDEWRVLNEGAHISNIAGQCIVQGEVRNIQASKRPVYRNGVIVGLVGYFFDVVKQERAADLEDLPTFDPVAGVLNFTGLEAATWRFVDSYKRLGTDFAMISINIESFDYLNEEFGYEFGDKLLGRIGEVLRDVAGSQCVAGHVHSDRFVILAQEKTDEELQAMCDLIERRLVSIAEIDGTRCTVFALAGFARYSQLRDVEAMKRYNRDHRLERRSESGGGFGKGDVITPMLFN